MKYTVIPVIPKNNFLLYKMKLYAVIKLYIFTIMVANNDMNF